MDVQVFWEAISAYNRQTAAVQAVLLTFLLGMTALSYAGKVRWAAKCALGVVHLFLAAVFLPGTEGLPSSCSSLSPFFWPAGSCSCMSAGTAGATSWRARTCPGLCCWSCVCPIRSAPFWPEMPFRRW